jgi:hypothetical protein
MTINRVREYLRPDSSHRHPVTGRMGAPRVYFIRKTTDYPQGCHEVLTDIRAAKRVEVGILADGSKVYSDERDETVRDHWLDCVRYAIGMRPALGPVAAEAPAEPGTIRIAEYTKLMELEDARAQTEARRGYTGRFTAGY